MKKSRNSSAGSSSNLDRKTIERNRRIHMKGLCFKLVSLIPPNQHKSSNKDLLSQLDQLDQAALYIQELQKRVDELKRRKQSVMSINNMSTTNGSSSRIHHHQISDETSSMKSSLLRLPILEFRELDSNLEVILITGLNKNFMFYEVITVLEEEGAEVVNASFSIVGDKVYHTIHSQVTNSRIGVETSRLCQRLKDLIHS